MALTNLMTVLKTVLVGTAKRPTPADRVGTGFHGAIAHEYPATILSPGQFPVPQLSEPAVRSRQEIADVQMSMPPGTDWARSAGSNPGKTVRRAVNDVNSTLTTSRTNRASLAWSLARSERIGSDCQSPDRDDAKQDLRASLRLQAQHRVAGPITVTGK